MHLPLVFTRDYDALTASDTLETLFVYVSKAVIVVCESHETEL
jgi:hypothetical protein